jgi:hypothetical protein
MYVYFTKLYLPFAAGYSFGLAMSLPCRIVTAIVVLYGQITIIVSATASANITHDPLIRVVTLVESPHATRIFSCDPADNRTNYSANPGFSVAVFANHQIATDTSLSIPIITTGSLSSSDGQWTVHSSNRQWVPESSL